MGLSNVGHKMSSAKIAVIALASTMGAVISLGVIWLIMLKCNSNVQSLDKATELNDPSGLKRPSRSGTLSFSFEPQYFCWYKVSAPCKQT